MDFVGRHFDIEILQPMVSRSLDITTSHVNEE